MERRKRQVHQHTPLDPGNREDRQGGQPGRRIASARHERAARKGRPEHPEPAGWHQAPPKASQKTRHLSIVHRRSRIIPGLSPPLPPAAPAPRMSRVPNGSPRRLRKNRGRAAGSRHSRGSPRVALASVRARLYRSPTIGARSSAEEHYLDMVGVTGSIPVAPTTPSRYPPSRHRHFPTPPLPDTASRTVLGNPLNGRRSRALPGSDRISSARSAVR